MADSFTPTLNLTKPEINQSINTWGNKLNGDMDLIDSFAGAKNAEIAALTARVVELEARRVQHGMIMMWAGADNAVPAGWQLCNGSGTPDLRDKFVVASGPTRPSHTVGGANSQTVGTTTTGSHSHGGGTFGHALTEAEMPPHAHGGGTDAQGHHDHALPLTVAAYGLAGGNGGLTAHTALNGAIRTEAGGAHWHSITTDTRGGGGQHNHTIGPDGNHAHNVTVATVPVYYAIAFIMKVG